METKSCFLFIFMPEYVGRWLNGFEL